MDDKTISQDIQKALDRFNKCVLLDPEDAAKELFESHSEIMTSHQSDINVEYVNKVINGK